MQDFGIIISSYKGDYCFAKGVCASIRYFLGDVPICLVTDGILPTAKLEEAYGVQVINYLNVNHDLLRRRSFGFGLTKMIALWESPWEHFLFLDADTVVWGNLLQLMDFKTYDFIVGRPDAVTSRAEIERWFFNVEKISTYFPDFDWQEQPYFCSGTFFAKRGLFALEEYSDLLDRSEAESDLFFWGEQGLLNFMVLRAAQHHRLRLGHFDFQVNVADYPLEHLQQRFQTQKISEPQRDACVIHWSGKKPFILRSGVYPEPMNFFRHKFFKDVYGYGTRTASTLMMLEDIDVYLNKIMHRFKRSQYTNQLKPNLTLEGI